MRRPTIFLAITAALWALIAVLPANANAATIVRPAGPVTIAYHAPQAPQSVLKYTVRNGDTLSKIAAKALGSSSRWPALWWVNRKKIGNPNSITTGQALNLPRKSLRGRWLMQRALSAIAPAPTTQATPPSTAAPAPPQPSGPVHVNGSAFEQCVMMAESGGDPRAYNQSSGASGLFGDLLSTWLSLGLGYSGGAYTAPVSVQVAGFWKLYGEDGMSPWDADGCPQKFGSAYTAAYTVSNANGGGGTGGSGSSASAPLRLKAMSWAHAQAGCWYQWGGTGPCRNGFDCSGLIYEAYLHYGVNIGRDTYEMLQNRHLRRISEAQAQRGDLAFYGSGHVELVWQKRWHRTFGAHDTGQRIGSIKWGPWWYPTMFFRVV